MVTYKTATTDKELQQIIELQSINLPANISEQESREQGFVTVKHDFDLLSRMNQEYQHIIAKDGDEVVGYALVMLRNFVEDIPVLQSMVDQINQVDYKGKKLRDSKYFIMGQVCVAKDYRSKGVFAGLYQHMKICMSPHFDWIITEISNRNTRSMRAHEKVGFETVYKYADKYDDWLVVLWDWH